MSEKKAIVFSHFGNLQYGSNEAEFLEHRDQSVETYENILRNYLECNNIAIVYIYIDWAIRATLLRLNSSSIDPGRLQIGADLLFKEQELKGIIGEALRRAQNSTGKSTPVIHPVGWIELNHFFDSLYRIDPALMSLLFGEGGRFTYDSPKLVEAIIRLARGQNPFLAMHPILRIDEDVIPNSDAIERLLAKYTTLVKEHSFFFFSGSYGDPAALGEYDPINDHAVRTHWFTPPGTKAGDRLVNSPITSKSDRIHTLDVIRTFLSELNEFGATQQTLTHSGNIDNILGNIGDDCELKTLTRDNAIHLYSNELKKQVNNTDCKHRTQPQVISGAGLIMSRNSISLLPPFMNIKNNTIWIDDYLKRRLHEELNDIGSNDIENVILARFKQNRHPGGVLQENIDKADEYFERLLRGCLFLRVITDRCGKPTEYSKTIQDIVLFKLTQEQYTKMHDDLENTMTNIVKRAFDLVIKCWSSETYRGYKLHKWASKKNNEESSAEICTQVINDSVRYIKLLFNWHKFTRAIERLSPGGHQWLFDDAN